MDLIKTMKDNFNTQVETERQRIQKIQDSARKVHSQSVNIMNTLVPGLGNSYDFLTKTVGRGIVGSSANPYVTMADYTLNVPAPVQAPMNVVYRDYVIPIVLAAYGGAELLGAKATASAAATSKVVPEVAKATRQAFTNPELERVFQQYITRFPKATSTQFRQFLNRNHKNLERYFINEADRFVIENPGTVDATVNLVANKMQNNSTFMNKVMEALKSRNPFSNKTLENLYMQFRSRFPNATPEQFRQYLSKNYKELESTFVKEIEKFPKNPDEVIKLVTTEAKNLRNKAETFVKNPENKPIIDKAMKYTGGVLTLAGIAAVGNQVLDNINNNQSNSNLVEMSKVGAEELRTLMKTLGARKGEEGDVLKFAGQVAQLMENSPVNIERKSAGQGVLELDDLGLSAYDLYQEYKNSGGNLIQSVLKTGSAGVSGIISTVLGFGSHTKLGRWAEEKLLGKDKEYREGKAVRNLSEYIPDEFPTGQSGRKYHVVGDRIYAYDTGKPVDVQTAIDDINAKYAFDYQQEQNKLAQDRSLIEEFQEAQNNGYNIGGDLGQTISNYNNNVRQLNPPVYIDTNEYTQDKDIVQQVRQDSNSKSAMDTIRAEIYRRLLYPEAPQQMDYQTLYQDTYKVLADSISSQLDNYFNPKAFAYEYKTLRSQALLGEAPYMSEQEFYEMKKAQQLQNMQPQILAATNEVVNKMQKMSPDYLDKDTAKILLEDLKSYEDMNRQQGNAIADKAIKLYDLETQRQQNQIQQYQKERELGLKAYDIQQQNQYNQGKLALDQQQYELNKQNAPYQNFNRVGAGMSGIGMSGENVNNVIGTMQPEMVQQIFPGAVSKSLPYQQIVLPNTQVGRNR